jgi:predicted ribosome quality control (RQC) complex YloA/Tae2 family protein
MIELTSVDVRYAVRELQQMVGAKVEKVFQSDRDLLFIMYLGGSPKINLRCILPGFISTTQHKPDYPQQPPGFAMFLRKYLTGTRLEKVAQQGFDRIIQLSFSSKTDKITLVIELMPPGNMLLLDAQGRIINLLENQQFKDRMLRGKQPYVAPPSTDIGSDEEILKRITESTRDKIVTTLAITCSLGGLYAEEVCKRANIDKNRGDLNAAELREIIANIRKVLDEPIAAHADASRPYPFKMQSRETTPCEQTSFLAALGEIVPSKPKEIKQRASPQNKIQAIIDAQRQQVTKFTEEIALSQRTGECMYEEYQQLHEILVAVQEARAQKNNINEVLKRFKQVKSYNAATGELEIEW